MDKFDADLSQALDSADAALARWWDRVNRYPADLQALMRSTEAFRDAEAAARAAAGPDPRGDAYAVLDKLADVYLSSPDDRDAIRRKVGNKRALLESMYGYVGRNADRILETGGREWLRRGIAIAAIEDLRTDFRDLYGYLGRLYLAAEARGLDPHADLLEVGEMASRSPDRHGASTKDFLMGFEASAAFAELRRTGT
jgi:hypothetical protein